MSHLIKFLKEAHTFYQQNIYNLDFETKKIIIIDDSPEMMDFTADEFCDVPDEKDLLETKLLEDELMDNLTDALVSRGNRDRIDHIVTMLISKAEDNMKERTMELLK
jgi:hypothetical protein